MRIALVAMLLLAPAAALAGGECGEFSGGSPALRAADPAARLQFIRASLKREAPGARLWTGAWGGGYSVLTLGQLAVIPLFPPADRVDWYAGALSTAVGAALIIGVPLEVADDAAKLEAKVMASAATSSPCATLAEAEHLFLKNAEAEAFGVSWALHAANVAFNVLVGLVLGLGYGHWESGAINALVGTAIGEAMIFTQPTHLVSDLERYRAGNLAPVATPTVPTFGGFGLRIGATF